MLLKIAALGIAVSIFATFLNKYYKEAVLPLELSFGVAVTLILTDRLKEILNELSAFSNDANVSTDIFESLIKGAVICIVTKLSSDVAKDTGNNFASDIIELSGRIMIIALCFPFAQNVIKIALSFAS